MHINTNKVHTYKIYLVVQKNLKKLILTSIPYGHMSPKKNSYTFFHKFLPINEFLLENLSRNQLYFNDPCNYNDPFDSKIYGYSECTEKQWIKDCRSYHPEISVEQAKEALKYNIEEGKLHRKGKMIVADSFHTNSMGPLTSCFSLDPDNILMWSHYANYHKGICLRFKAKHRPETPGFRHTTKYRLTIDSEEAPLFRVNYNITKPSRIDVFKVSRTLDVNSFFDFLLTKSPCWIYEKEYRIISQNNKNIKNFEKSELEGIIFGLRVKYCDANMVYKTIEKNYINKGININFCKAQEKEDEYAIDIMKIDDIEEYIESLSQKI